MLALISVSGIIKYDLKDEEMRPYFALPAVLDDVFKVGKLE
jgi:Zn-dependent oligopeptidase